MPKKLTIDHFMGRNNDERLTDESAIGDKVVVLVQSNLQDKNQFSKLFV
jgi:hypothetical protein